MGAGYIPVCYLILSIVLFSRLSSGSGVFRSREFQHYKTVLKSGGRRRGSWMLCSHCNHLGTLPKCDSVLVLFPLPKHSWGPIMCTKNPNGILRNIIIHVKRSGVQLTRAKTITMSILS